MVFLLQYFFLLPDIKMVQKVVKIFTGLQIWTSKYIKFIARQKSGFEEYPVVPAAGIHKGLTFLGTTMDIHIPHKDTMTSHNENKSNV